MALEATKKRLRQAQFFLGLLATVDRPSAMTPQSEAAEFYLDAFVNAARSVEWVLQQERTDEWRAWIEGWVAGLSEREKAVRKYFVAQRNYIQKQGGPELTFTLTPLSVTDFMREIASQGGEVFIGTGMPGTPQPPITAISKTLTEHPDLSLSAACQPFFELTARLVADFERDHPA